MEILIALGILTWRAIVMFGLWNGLAITCAVFLLMPFRIYKTG